MFIGEAPGADEDSTGLPFSGPAGQLLDRMIAAIGLSADDVYLSNVIKCKTPRTRIPDADELAACRTYWEHQIELVQPKIVVTLGKVASQAVFATNAAIAELRGKWRSYKGRPAMATYHPAFLLRNPSAKKDAWEDLKSVRAKLSP
jgi:DNA polymerase